MSDHSSSSDDLTDPLPPEEPPDRLTQPNPSPAPPAWTSAAEPTEPLDPPAGGRYQAHSFHKPGGMGRVWRARDSELGRDVAFKEIRPKYANDELVRRRFVFEAEVTGRLEHPAVIPVYGFGRDADGRPYYAMRFVEGKSLQEAIAEFYAPDGPTGADRAVALRRLLGHFLTVCRAIDYAHSRGIIHRDLKPANIMIGDYGETLVVDWGVAKRLRVAEGEAESCPVAPGWPGAAVEESNNSEPGDRIGTKGYWSPEQAAGAPDLHDERTDVYGLGAVLFTILTGTPPHPNGVHFPQPPSARAMCPWVDAGIDEIARTALALDRAERYQTAAAVAQAVELWLADQPLLAQRGAVAALARAASEHPTDLALAEQLARQRSNLGLMLAGIGRDKEALDEYRSAADVFGRLAGAANQPRFLAERAGTLLALSRSCAALGREQEAITADQEATSLYKKLAEMRPEETRSIRIMVSQSRSSIELELPEEVAELYAALPPVPAPDVRDSSVYAAPPAPDGSAASIALIELPGDASPLIPTTDAAIELPPLPASIAPPPAEAADLGTAPPKAGDEPDSAVMGQTAPLPIPRAPSGPDSSELSPPPEIPAADSEVDEVSVPVVPDISILYARRQPPAPPEPALPVADDDAGAELPSVQSDQPFPTFAFDDLAELPPVPPPDDAGEAAQAEPGAKKSPSAGSVPDIATLFPESPRPAEPESALRLASGYTRLKELARGGMGVLSLARDESLNRLVVVKTLAERYSVDSRAARRFRREVQITGALEHPNVVRAYSSGTAGNGRPYLVLEYLTGSTLQQLLDTHGPGWSNLVLDPLAQACDGLHYAHTRGIVHRDAKLSNIVVLPLGRTVVLDWGVAKVIEPDAQPSGAPGVDSNAPDDAARSRVSALVGTPAYMAPEQARGEAGAIGPRTDVFTLGANLFHLATGQPPGHREDLREVIARRGAGDIPRLCDVRPDVPPQLDAICSRALAFRAEDRYPTAAALAADLRAFLASQVAGA